MGRKENSCCNEYHIGERVNMATRGAGPARKYFFEYLNRNLVIHHALLQKTVGFSFGHDLCICYEENNRGQDFVIAYSLHMFCRTFRNDTIRKYQQGP